MRALMLALCLLVPLNVQAQQGPADQARAAADLLESAGEELEAAGTARDRVQALTQTIMALEEGLSALRSGLRQASLHQAELAAKLQAEDEQIAALLAVLMRAGDPTSPVILLHPGGPTGTARAGMLLADTAPAMNAQVQSLRRDLQELNDLRMVQTDAVAQLDRGLESAQQARTALSKAISERTDLPKRFVSDPVREAILLSSAQTLNSFAAGLDQISAGIAPPAPTEMDGAKGALDLPVAGQVLRQFGEADAAGIKRPGIIIATAPAALVTSPVAATLRYVGPLLDFGQVVILEPQADVLFVFAGLGAIYAQTGDVIEAGAPLGLMSDGPGKNSDEMSTVGDETGNERLETLYIEVRDSNTPQDPSLWFRTEQNG